MGLLGQPTLRLGAPGITAWCRLEAKFVCPGRSACAKEQEAFLDPLVVGFFAVADCTNTAESGLGEALPAQRCSAHVSQELASILRSRCCYLRIRSKVKLHRRRKSCLCAADAGRLRFGVCEISNIGAFMITSIISGGSLV